jgi:tRNA dimethylallyltransferase
MPQSIDPITAPIVVIVGPTGSGKSALALCLAERFSGEVVNCDSMQLYRGFDVATAKLPAHSRRGVPHHLMDVLDPAEVYSAGDYARDARRIIAEISARRNLPVVAGGTGFYLRALQHGLPDLPARDPALRERLEKRETSRLHALLARLDPAASRRIHPRDRQKLIRAVEIRVLTRHPAPPSDSADVLVGFRTLVLGLDPDRAALYNNLDARAREMFRCGLLEEVERFLDSGATGAEKPFESLGYKQALAHLRGALTLEQAIESTQIETRQYAKRQWTWFRRDKSIVWLKGFGADPEVVSRAVDLVGQVTNPNPTHPNDIIST